VGYVPYAPVVSKPLDWTGSVYIPVDSWMYPALNRLYGMGFVDSMFLGMRPYTRRGVMHMLLESEDAILSSDNEQAQDILAKLLHELSAEVPSGNVERGFVYGLDSTYTRFLGIGGPILRDSFHLGQTISNDYGRPYQTGFNAIAGASTVEEWDRFRWRSGESTNMLPPRTDTLSPWRASCRRSMRLITRVLSPRFPWVRSRRRIHFGWWRPTPLFICWGMRSRAARWTHGLDLERAERWRGPIMRRISIRSASIESSRCIFLTCRS